MDNFYMGGDRSYYSSVASAKVSKDDEQSFFTDHTGIGACDCTIIVLGLYKNMDQKSIKIQR